MDTRLDLKLSEEQELFICKALEGKNILVDACIGSGKTTAIQVLCNRLPDTKKVLYLTYNRLLKLDARAKIQKRNVTVTNYHGFAYAALKANGISAGVSDLIQRFIQEKPAIGAYDILIIDEYQDIEQELAELLQMIKDRKPGMQIIAVGDMEQKIYDKTTLDVESFMKGFLEDHLRLRFTRCFRLSGDLAAMLGRVWKKEIRGVNESCRVEEMTKEEVMDFLAQQEPGDILCLGARTGAMAGTLNALEEAYPHTFNKTTVYATISDHDSAGKTEPKADSAIFTTYDSSKGLERKICVIFDFTESYWNVRISKPQQSYSVLRNIFCVAASRGKNHIIFVKSEEAMLSEKTLSTFVETNQKFKDTGISEMFDFKYKEDVEVCFSKLKLKKLREKETRYVTAVNHAVTKALISQYGAGTLFIIEDLTGIRTATEQVRLKSRYVMVSWAFDQFREMLEYKAALSQSEVLAADPKYTSQSCPVCGNTTKANRSRKRHEFCCTACGYRSNDDRTGAINIYRKGYNTLFAEAC